MRTRILTAVSLVTLAFVVVVAIVLARLQQVADSIQKESRESIPLYRAAVALADQTLCLETQVNATFLAKTEMDLADNRNAALGIGRELEATTRLLAGDEFRHSHTARLSRVQPTPPPSSLLSRTPSHSPWRSWKKSLAALAQKISLGRLPHLPIIPRRTRRRPESPEDRGPAHGPSQHLLTD